MVTRLYGAEIGRQCFIANRTWVIFVGSGGGGGRGDGGGGRCSLRYDTHGEIVDRCVGRC
jgi:hypothetical protein